MIGKLAMRLRKKMKFGIVIPVIYNEAVELDRINDNTYGKDATKKERKNVEVDFKFLDDGSK